jgi:hypothetical protein
LTVVSEAEATPATPKLLADAAQMFGLCGFAIAQPLFDLLGDNPAFFVAHDLDGFDVVLFALALLVIPALLAFGVLFLARLVSDQLARIVRIVLTAILVSLTITPVLSRTIGFGTKSWIGVFALLAVGVGFAYARIRHIRTFVMYLSPAPLLFLVVFMFISPVQVLIFGGDPAAAAVNLKGTRTNVVVVAFDEFPLGLLLDEQGAIDGTRYPNFARLAAMSTWYPKATSVSPATHIAIPSILTGTRVKNRPVPVAADHPHSLFTLFANSHTIYGGEIMTRLCPNSICEHIGRTDAPSVTGDLKAVYLRQVLPDSTANAWGVPSIEGAWGGFNSAGTDEASKQTQPADEGFGPRDQPARFKAFVRSVRKHDKTSLWFHHSVLPHTPYLWLPDGRPYNVDGPRAFTFLYWPDDDEVLQLYAQRLVIQTMYVDRLLGSLLDRLEDKNMLDDTMLVVTADHGASFSTGGNIRDTDTPSGRDGTVAIPLFVRYPGQEQGEVDQRDASEIDVLPTIADTLGVQTPRGWHFDGRSLRKENPASRPTRVLVDNDAKVVKTFEGIDPRRVAEFLRGFLYPNGGLHDPYRLGPHGPLVGESLDDLTIGEPHGRARAEDWSLFDKVDLDGPIPSLLIGIPTGTTTGGWVAVAVNGTIAGVGPVYTDSVLKDDRFMSMLDPSFFKNGRNDVEIFEIDPDGRTLHPLTREG